MDPDLYREADEVIATRIDLISACHVHILEPQWNPMTESQAIGRVHRIGQTQQVSVTRYIVSRSIETVSEVLARPLSQREVDPSIYVLFRNILSGALTATSMFSGYRRTSYVSYRSL